MIVLLLIILVALGLFYVILQLDVWSVWKFWLVVAEMIAVNQLLIRRYKFPSELGLILLKSKKGVELIDRIAKNDAIWKFFSDMGNTLAYGVMSIFITPKNTRTDRLLAGLLMLGILWFVVVPYAMIFLAQLLGTGMTENMGMQAQQDYASYISMLIVILVFIGGFFLLLVLSIISYSLIILSDFFGNLLNNGVAASTVEPGGTFLLPGINLPLLEGVLALVVVLVVHEGAHAILSRVGKIPLLSSGIVLFGIIPIGAFVEPDEKQLAKLDQVKQTRVLIAGSTSNLMFSFILFIPFILVYNAIVMFDPIDPSIVPLVRFVYVTLGLMFSLNFVVGTVNMLPIPFFDGYRVLDANIKNKTILKAVMVITVLAFALNFLPHLFS